MSINKNNKVYKLYTISDEHLSEKVLDYNNIVKYKTDFTGDTGMYLESDKKGYLIVDGRFKIQARNEIKNKKIQIVDINREYDLYDFLYDLFKKSDRKVDLYIDSKRESINKVNKIINVIDKINKKHKKNLLTIKYKDLFLDKKFIEYRKNIFHMTSAPLFLLDDNKIKLFDKNIVKKVLDDNDVYVTSSKEEIAYFTNLRYQFCDVNNMGIMFDAFLILMKNKSMLYIHDYVDEKIEKLFNKHNVHIKDYEEFYKDLRTIKNKKICIDKTINNYNILRSISKKDIRYIENSLDQMMSICSDVDIKNIKKANVIDGVSITNAIYTLKNEFNKFGNKVTEYNIANFVDNERRKNKAFLCPSFDTIVAYKANSAICHYVPKAKKSKIVDNNGILLIDSGGHYILGTTDITRTISMYKNKSNIPYEIKYNYTLVLKSMLNVQNQIFPYGYCGREIDMVARKDLFNNCLDYDHGTGHGIGYVTNVHFGPNSITPGIAVAKENNILEENQVQSTEPGLYFKNKYGIRIENDTYVSHYKNTEYGEMLRFVPLTLCPIDKDLIDIKMLNNAEKKYLNGYHALVYKKLSKYFKSKKLSWLKECCKKI